MTPDFVSGTSVAGWLNGSPTDPAQAPSANAAAATAPVKTHLRMNTPAVARNIRTSLTVTQLVSAMQALMNSGLASASAGASGIGDQIVQGVGKAGKVR